MVTRTPLNRDRHRQPTPELAMRFARLCELAPIRLACIRGTSCHATTLNEHCVRV